MQNVVLNRRQITPTLRQALNLPPDTWQLVINRGFTIVSFMDGKFQVHHLEINDLARQRAKKELFVQ